MLQQKRAGRCLPRKNGCQPTALPGSSTAGFQLLAENQQSALSSQQSGKPTAKPKPKIHTFETLARQSCNSKPQHRGEEEAEGTKLREQVTGLREQVTGNREQKKSTAKPRTKSNAKPTARRSRRARAKSKESPYAVLSKLEIDSSIHDVPLNTEPGVGQQCSSVLFHYF